MVAMHEPHKSQQQYRNDVYEVGWICALHTELAAARAMLDEDRGIAHFNENGDPNTYALGRIHQHNVVIACLPAGIDGTNAATTVAQNLLRTFPQIRIGLLVGIGGGIPDLAKGIDIRLGDVVVSQPSGEHGGVIQYAKGKAQEDGDGSGHHFVRKGSLNKPPIFILKALNMLRAEHETEESKMSVFLQEMLDRKPKMKRTGYTFPGIDKDHLFELSAIEMRTIGAGEQDLQRDYSDVSRPSRESNEPMIHYGNIASGDLVIKHAGIRDALRDNLGAICVEMEAAGLMDTFPCLVIRGICDYADSSKNDVWHPYAAATAAAYAKEFLLYVSPGQVHQGPSAKEVMDFRTHELLGQNIEVQERTLHHHHHVAEEEKIREEKKRALQCHQSFACVYEEYKDVNPDRASGTCEWVLNHPQFEAWQQSRHDDLLWISADPGCGKSVLAKTLIDHELREKQQTICYFFFKDNVQQDSVRIALKALLHQLFSQQPQLVRYAVPVWETKGSKASYEVSEMWRIFIDATTDSKAVSTFCVLDALDECREDDRRMLITMVSDYYRQRSSQDCESTLKFLITSRPYTSVERWFNPIVAELPQIRLRGEDENDRIHQEINLVISQRVDELAKDFLLSSVNRQWLLQKLLQMEHRTYLWLHLAMDEIRNAYENCLNPDDVQIESVPISVNDAYERILGRINTQAKSNARKVLMIILGVQRPLTVGEMALALVASSTYDSGIESAQLPNQVRLKEQIRQWCGLFVFINHSKLFLIHQTAKEFLLANELPGHPNTHSWQASLAMTEVNEMLAKLCVQHLFTAYQREASLLEERTEENETEIELLRTQVPTRAEQDDFFTYCARYWALHLEDQYVTKDQSLLNRVLSLCDAKSHLFTKWFPVLWNGLEESKHRERPQVLGQHIFALTGHSALLTELSKEPGFDVEARDSEGNTALLWASERGINSAVICLLDAGADVNAQGGIYGSPLHAASAKGHEKVARTLLNRRANVNLSRYCSKHHENWNGLSPLSLAAGGGQVGVAKLLLEQDGVDINAKGHLGMTAILLAVTLGQTEATKLLLQNEKLEINLADSHGRSPLMAATEVGHLEAVELLLENSTVDVNLCDAQGQTSLSLAVLGGNIELVKAHLRSGIVDVNRRDLGGHSCLSQASERGQVAAVKLLLEHPSIDIDSKDLIGQTPWDRASKEGHSAVVKLLEDWKLDHQTEQNSTISQDTRLAPLTKRSSLEPSPDNPNDISLDAIINKLFDARTTRPRTTNHVPLRHEEIRYLCAEAREAFLEASPLLELEAPVTICGDIRGSYTTLLDIFKICGRPPETVYLFLGNYVDRGPQSLETICLLLALKIKYRERFFLLRGNHECAGLTRIYGFYDDCKRRYCIRLWKAFTDCFNCMPFAAIVADKIFAVHAGLGPYLSSLDLIRSIHRPTDIPDYGLLCDLLWSNPDANIDGWAASDREVSFLFGSDIVSEFLQTHDLDLICRSHNIVDEGYEFFAERQLVTIFSQANYHGEFKNAGAVMRVEADLFCLFQVFKPTSQTWT